MRQGTLVGANHRSLRKRSPPYSMIDVAFAICRTCMLPTTLAKGPAMVGMHRAGVRSEARRSAKRARVRASHRADPGGFPGNVHLVGKLRQLPQKPSNLVSNSAPVNRCCALTWT